MKSFKNISMMLFLHIIFTAVLEGFLSGRVMAQQPVPRQENMVALVGGDIYLADGEVLPGSMILFANGKIEAVGYDIAVPEGAEVIDVTGLQIHPGLVLGRTTLGLTEIGRHAESTDLVELGNINPNVRPQVAFHPASEHIGVAAVHGITTAVVMPAGGILSGQVAAMMTDGWTWEAMTLRAPLGLVIHWPSGRSREAMAAALDALTLAFDDARRYMLAREAAANDKATSHPIDLRWEAMMPVLKEELPVFVVAQEVGQILAAMAWAEKEGLKMVLVGGRDAGYLAEQLAEKNIAVMITPVIAGPARPWEGYDQSYRLASQLHEAGVQFCIAGEPSAAGAYRLAHHAAAATAFGLPEKEAWKAVTIYAAQILGIDNLVGSLETGKDATIMVTNGNPLETMSTTEMVFIKGRRIDQTDKHKRLYERYMEKHRQANQ